jgi:hypothetical protein
MPPKHKYTSNDPAIPSIKSGISALDSATSADVILCHENQNINLKKQKS